MTPGTDQSADFKSKADDIVAALRRGGLDEGGGALT